MRYGPIMVDLRATTLSGNEARMLAHPLVGGLILFSRNYQDPSQLNALIRQARASHEGPLLVAVDHEGGRVQRFRRGFSELPPMARLGELHARAPERALRMAEELGWLLAAELRAVDVDFSFTPVLDLGRGISEVIGDRAFGAEPARVAELAGALRRGLGRAGMAAVGKHFPGHGGVAPDSHVSIPVDERPWQEILDEDLQAFAALFAQGLEAVMPAHVIYPRMDSAPAGFSRHWLQEVLRGEMGFTGAIFSDDLSMAGAAVVGDVLQRTRAALAAGCDMALVCNDPEAAMSVLEGLEDSVEPADNPRLAAMQARGEAAADLDLLRAGDDWRQARASLQAVLESGD